MFCQCVKSVLYLVLPPIHNKCRSFELRLDRGCTSYGRNQAIYTPGIQGDKKKVNGSGLFFLPRLLQLSFHAEILQALKTFVNVYH